MNYPKLHGELEIPYEDKSHRLNTQISDSKFPAHTQKKINKEIINKETR